jgi:hypothetical protein
MALDVGQGVVNLAATLIGGGIAAFTGLRVAGINTAAERELRKVELQAKRDEYQKGALTELLDALGDWNKATGDELRSLQDTRAISEDANLRSFAAQGRVRALAARLRNRDLRGQVMAYAEGLNHEVLLYRRDTLMDTVRRILDAYQALQTAIAAELDAYL